MKNLSRHIEYLLLEHDKVIVPTIGAFVTTYRPARFIEEDNTFLPPMKSVRLDERDTQDDGMLRDCLVHLHHVTAKVASKWIDEYVTDIRECLLDDGIYEVGSIGNLIQEDGAPIEFHACEAGVNSPVLYGLDTFRFDTLPQSAHQPIRQEDPTHITIRLRRSTIRRVAAVAAVLVVAVMIIVPGYNTLYKDGGMARVFSTESIRNAFHITKPQEGVFTEEVKEVKEVQEVQEVQGVQKVQVPETRNLKPETRNLKPETRNLKPSETAPQAQPQPSGFVIVLASAIPQKNAEEYVRQLTTMGISNVSAIQDGKMLRVIKSGFSSQNEAITAMRDLRDSGNEQFSQIWIKKI